MSLSEQQQQTQSRRNAVRAVTCCALCMMALVFHLPTTAPEASTSTDSLRGPRKNFDKETIAASNLTGADVKQQVTNNNNNSTRSNDDIVTTSNATTRRPNKDNPMDFLVAGFAKCGTTSLLKTFEAHNETAVAPKEECSMDKIDNDDEAHANVLKALNASSSSEHVTRRGIKCPFTFSTEKSLQRMEEWFPNTKLIYGLRHPVKAFESYYNYRVLTVHQGKIKGPIPSAETLIGSNEWERVSTDAVRFEKILKQLLTNQEETPLKHPVFMYTVAQMEDESENEALRETLGSFLELEYPIEPLVLANVNRHTGDNGYEETINICDTEHDELRSILIANGMKTQQWIRDRMLPHVTVSNPDSFVELLKQWGTDPCDASPEEMERM